MFWFSENNSLVQQYSNKPTILWCKDCLDVQMSFTVLELISSGSLLRLHTSASSNWSMVDYSSLATSPSELISATDLHINFRSTKGWQRPGSFCH